MSTATALPPRPPHRLTRHRRRPQARGCPACRERFLHFFPRGFRDPRYLDWERGYKQEAHERWQAELAAPAFRRLLAAGEHAKVASTAVAIESRTNLLFSFEKMALRDAVRDPAGAEAFARGLYALLHGRGELRERFAAWVEVVAGLPRRQTRVLTWPLVTVFGFLAQPDVHVFLKPLVTRRAAAAYEVDFPYRSRPNWETYASLLALAERVLADQADLGPRDMIDAQSFLWVVGSDEYDGDLSDFLDGDDDDDDPATHA